MNRNIITVVIAFAIILGGAMWLSTSNSQKPTSSMAEADLILHKSPTCGCCAVWGDYMRREGYEVAVSETSNLGAIKSDLGVPRSLESCHTTEVGGYVVEGHIPNEAIIKLLAEQPDIKGIGMAGMPSGSPGMPGPKMSDFVIYEITHEGKQGNVFMTI